MSILAIILFKY